MTKLLYKLLLNKYRKGGGKKPTGEISIIENGTYDVTNYASADVNVKSSGGVTEKDVNFYDYDGTVVNSYSTNDFINLTEMPENPSHNGLIAQGWNWSLSDAKTYVAQYGKLNIGQMYVTDDGKTRIYIHLEEGRLGPYLGFAVNGTVTVNWGDGNTQTITGQTTYTKIYTQHNYLSAGNYTITLESSSTIYLIGDSTKGGIITKNNSNGNENKVYNNGLIKIELGSNISIGQSAFNYCNNLKNITMPNGVTSIGQYAFASCQALESVTIPNGVISIQEGAFNGCNNLKSVTIPNSVTTIGQYAFMQCRTLESITMPNNITSIGQSAFNYCVNLKYITISNNITSIGESVFSYCQALEGIIIPNSVTSIGQYAFNNCFGLTSIIVSNNLTSINSYTFMGCYGIAYYDFSNNNSVPTLASTTAFASNPSDFKIIVPDNLYNDWIVAQNWANFANNIVKNSKYNN